jgi:starch-binding outer membrane protein, SusD/RagB family
MKTKFFIIGFAVLLVTGFSSCTDWLTVKPQSEVVLADFWKTRNDVEAVLASCYRGLTEDDVVYRMIVWGELRSDNLIKGSAGFASERSDMKNILEGNLTPSNKYASWGSFYSVINQCNYILYYAPEVVKKDNNFTVDDYNKIKSEVLTIRSLCYFYLVRTFKNVPYVTNPSIDDTQDYLVKNWSEQDVLNSNRQEQDVLDSITSDLLVAQKYARTDFGRNDYNKGRVTLNVVNALLADVYLWNQKYDKCVETCDKVLEDTRLKLYSSTDAFTQVFYLKNSTESIFELQFSDNIQKNNPVYNLYGNSGNNGFGELGLPEFLAYYRFPSGKGYTGDFSPFNFSFGTKKESVEDVRADESYYPGFGSYRIFKYAGSRMYPSQTIGYAPTPQLRSGTSNWVIYRLSDLMLMKAEALVQLDGNDNLKNAMTLVNTTYLRSNPTQDSLKISEYQSKSVMEELVLRERQRELLFEGKRWYDLVRAARRNVSTKIVNDFVTHKATEGSTALNIPEMNALYMPISKSELTSNPKLKQNPYYDVQTTLTK